MRAGTALLLSLLLSLIVAGCTKDGGPPTSDVAGAAPWRSGETLEYALKNNKGESLGTATFGVTIAASGQTELTQRFRSDTTTDEITVVVDSKLKPLSASRRITAPDGSETIEVTYSEQGALIKQGDKQSGLSVPEHSYDNDSSLFLWRTLAFAPGYEASYNTIITNRRDRHKVNLEVLGRETIRVPAGEFSAWRLEVSTSNAKQIAWISDTPERLLLRYDNDRDLIFELERLPR